MAAVVSKNMHICPCSVIPHPTQKSTTKDQVPPFCSSVSGPFHRAECQRLSLSEQALQTTFPEWLCQAPWTSFCLSAIDVPLLHQPSAEMVLCCFSSGKCSLRNTVSGQRETINRRTEWTFRDAKRAFKNMSLGKASIIPMSGKARRHKKANCCFLFPVQFYLNSRVP